MLLLLSTQVRNSLHSHEKILRVAVQIEQGVRYLYYLNTMRSQADKLSGIIFGKGVSDNNFSTFF